MKMFPALIVLCIVLGVPNIVRAEIIEFYGADVSVGANAEFTVTETIEYTFTEEKHGIYRNIPILSKEKASHWFKERYLIVEVTEVRVDGSAVPYSIDTNRDELSIKIGDPEHTISGTHTYTIVYTVKGGVVYYPYGSADLYWNITGNAWEVPIRRVEARVKSPDGLFQRERSCYRGKEGLAGSCEPIFTEGDTVVFKAREVYPHEGVTIAQSLDRMRIPEVIFERYRLEFLWPPLILLLIAFGIYRAYTYKTAHRTGRPIVAQYEPYPNMKPMYTGVLMDGRLDVRDITACIVYLAEQGYLKIRKVERKVLFLFEVDDYEIELLKAPDEFVSTFEEDILELLFGKYPEVPARVSLSDFKNDTARQRANYKLIETLESDLGGDLVASGFYEKMSTKNLMERIGYVLMIGLGIAWMFPVTIIIAICGVVVSIITLLFVHARRTRKGYEVLDHLKGFKEFLEVTEKDRYWFHNAPEKSPEKFMEYLPYAIAFGVEEKWAAAFKDIALVNPTWYESNGATAFSAMNLSTSLRAFSDTLAPASGMAGAGGGAASSGGGFSGGGHGGGGGGSW